MTKVLHSRLTDEDCRALVSLPDGWTWCEAVGQFWVSRTDGIWTETFKALGPFDDIPSMVAAADREERRTRQEVERD